MPPARRRRTAPRVEVLRLGHRAARDPRLTTHLALTARAWGAERLYLHPPDTELAARLGRVNGRWGGSFEVIGVKDWRPIVREHTGHVVHLTMYGIPLTEALPAMLEQPYLLAVVGGAKVPAAMYEMSDWNVAVGHQPHSEVAALSVLLDRIRGTPGPGAWPGATHAIVPSARGKRVVEMPAP
jgi:tRNA (cytidine56-2'-O)-methyltransferase